MHSQDNDNPQFKRFGDMLRYFRNTYGDRMHQRNALMPRGVKLPATGLVECLNEHGYEISQSTYSEIESGATFPRYSGKFINTVCTCLGLESGKQEWKALSQQLVFDVVRDRFGEQIAQLAVNVNAINKGIARINSARRGAAESVDPDRDTAGINTDDESITDERDAADNVDL